MRSLTHWKKQAKEIKLDALTLYFAYRHSQTPWYAKLLSACVVAYAFSPIDLIPDFIPILGYLDDLVLVPLGVWISIKMIPPNVLQECRKQAEELEQRPTNWLAASIIILVWILIALFSIRFFASFVRKN
jgi:uncharacterized membrane protein YkvA (DUF1232 family)